MCALYTYIRIYTYIPTIIILYDIYNYIIRILCTIYTLYIPTIYCTIYVYTHMEHIHESEDPHRVLHTSSVSSSLFPVGSFWLHSLTVAVCKRGVGRGKGEVRGGERLAKEGDEN